MDTIERLRQKLHQLRTMDSQVQLFGAACHHYLLLPCLTEANVQKFEARHSITLPDDYRQFLLEMGNGGAGPSCGLFPLEESVVSDLTQPFLYIRWWNGVTPPNWFDLDLSPDEITAEADYGALWHIQGTLRLSHEGCGYYDHLVITGEERGHMWSDLRVGDAGIGPLPEYASEQRLTFFAWYEAWLDASLKERAT